MKGDVRTVYVSVLLTLLLITDHITTAQSNGTISHCERPSNCEPGTTCRGKCLVMDHHSTENRCLGQCISTNASSCEDEYGNCADWLHICSNSAVANVCRKSCGFCDAPEIRCSEGEFSCDGRCQPRQLFCDGVLDCRDRADEKGCSDLSEFWLKPGQASRRCGVRAFPPSINNRHRNESISIKRVSQRRRTKRLVEAKYAKPHSWPWVGLLLSAHVGYKTICGATLIHPEWALTAAHCVDSVLKNASLITSLSLTFGQHVSRTTAYSEKLTRQSRNITQIIPYTSYYHDSIFDDIALLKLHSPVERNDFVNVACMPMAEDLRRFRTAGGVVTGWGYDENYRLPRSLKQVTLKPMRISSCAVEVSDHLTPNFVTRLASSLLCTEKEGPETGGLCSGDSGGPLVGRRTTGTYALVGVSVFTSHEDCSKVGSASVYNSVYFYLPWISMHVRDLEYV